jgi:hypothetical protein
MQHSAKLLPTSLLNQKKDEKVLFRDPTSSRDNQSFIRTDKLYENITSKHYLLAGLFRDILQFFSGNYSRRIAFKSRSEYRPKKHATNAIRLENR